MVESLADAAGRSLYSRLRDYPVNSGQAAARLVVAALLANSRIKAVELAVLDALDAHALLRVERRHWGDVIHHLRADLLAAHGPGEAAIDSPLLDRLLQEISDPDLQRVVAGLSEAVVHADQLVEAREIAFLEAMSSRWGIEIPTLKHADARPGAWHRPSTARLSKHDH